MDIFKSKAETPDPDEVRRAQSEKKVKQAMADLAAQREGAVARVSAKEGIAFAGAAQKAKVETAEVISKAKSGSSDALRTDPKALEDALNNPPSFEAPDVDKLVTRTSDDPSQYTARHHSQVRHRETEEIYQLKGEPLINADLTPLDTGNSRKPYWIDPSRATAEATSKPKLVTLTDLNFPVMPDAIPISKVPRTALSVEEVAPRRPKDVVKTLNTAPSALDDAQLANGWAVTGETSPNDGHLGRIEKRALDTELHFPRVPDSIAVPKVARTRTVLPRSEAQVLNVDVAALDKKNKKLGLVPETLDEQWARAKKEPDNPEGINAFRTRPGGVPKVIEAAPGQEAQLEVLRQQRWAKIQELRQMIEASKNPDEAELFNEVLTQVMERYVADHGEMPVGI